MLNGNMLFVRKSQLYEKTQGATETITAAVKWLYGNSSAKITTARGTTKGAPAAAATTTIPKKKKCYTQNNRL